MGYTAQTDDILDVLLFQQQLARLLKFLESFEAALATSIATIDAAATDIADYQHAQIPKVAKSV